MKIYKDRNQNKKLNSSVNTCKKGTGFINNLINKLPVEVHLPGYQFCGPGTKLEKRLERGDSGINLLDSACKEHDIAYSKDKEIDKRHKADELLITKAKERLKAKHTPLGEKAAAAIVIALMKAKTKLGMGLQKKKKLKKKRILKAPKRGGFLPLLLPLLGMLGGLGGGAAGIATAVNKAQADKKLLEETQRHNKVMEGNAKGKGFRKKRSVHKKKKGKGLFIGPSQWYQKNYQ